MTIRNPPDAIRAPFTAQQLRAISQALKWRFLADVLLAVSGVEVFGVEVFAGLATWANELRQRADDAYASAFAAQGSADYANAQITGIAMVSDVGGGVSLSTGFDGAQSGNLGASWTQVYDGAGGGTLGLDGSGHTEWDGSGALVRRCFARHNTALSTDYQRARIVVTTVPENVALGAGPALYLVLRCNTDCTTLVFARISADEVAIGCLVSSTESVFATQSLAVSTGDTFDFYAGTDTDDREFILRRNGVTVIQHTDSGTSQFGAGYDHGGIGASVTSFLLVRQTDPGAITAWGAIDRLDTSY